MMTVPLTDELVLLAYDDEGVARGTGTNLHHGLAGALLLELTLAGRIDRVGKHVTVLDASPTGDDLADAALRRIAEDRRARKPEAWIDRLGKNLRPAVLDRLVAAGVLRREPGTVLWVFPRTRYPAPHEGRPPAEVDARRRLRTAVTTAEPVDARTAALCALVGALGWERRILPDLPKKQVKTRFQEIRKTVWAANAVKKVIDTEAATVVAAVA